jgi:hypothetical protein
VAPAPTTTAPFPVALAPVPMPTEFVPVAVEASPIATLTLSAVAPAPPPIAIEELSQMTVPPGSTMVVSETVPPCTQVDAKAGIETELSSRSEKGESRRAQMTAAER